eukprot:226462-Pyramimonas_sp.AAC.1
MMGQVDAAERISRAIAGPRPPKFGEIVEAGVVVEGDARGACFDAEGARRRWMARSSLRERS